MTLEELAQAAEAALEAAWDAWHYSETWDAWEAVEAAKEAVMAAKAAQEKPELKLLGPRGNELGTTELTDEADILAWAQPLLAADAAEAKFQAAHDRAEKQLANNRRIFHGRG